MSSRTLFSLLALIALPAATTGAAGDAVEYRYRIDVMLFSVQEGPQGPVKDSYDFHGSGSANTGSDLGLSCGDKGFQFEADVRPVEENQQLFVELEVTPRSNDGQVRPRKERLAMGDLKPVSLELAKNENDSRFYRLNLAPSVERIDHTKKALEGSTLELDRWNFSGSKVIVDNWRYAGKMDCSGMSLAFVDIAAFARLEFALVPFPDAQPIGSLENGTLTIVNGEGVNAPRVVIDNVKVGCPAVSVPGGPYEVWVKWSPSNKSVADAVRAITEVPLEELMTKANLDEATKAQLRARQQAVKEKAGALSESEFATDGVIAQLLGAVGLESGGGMIQRAWYLGSDKKGGK